MVRRRLGSRNEGSGLARGPVAARTDRFRGTTVGAKRSYASHFAQRVALLGRNHLRGTHSTPVPTMRIMASNPPSGIEGTSRKLNLHIIAGAVLAVLAVFFIAQNRRRVSVRLLFVTLHMRTWTVIIIAMVLGAALFWLLTRGMRSKRAKS